MYLLDVWDDMPQRRERIASEILDFVQKFLGRES